MRRVRDEMRRFAVATSMVITCSLLSVSTASAASGEKFDGGTKVASEMSPLDVLLVEDAIRQKWADYTLMIDGDGVANDRTKWAKRMFTEDLKWRWYDAQGKMQMAVNSRAEMEKAALEGRMQAPSKHLPITIKFDEVSPTSAKTRTVLLFLSVPRAADPKQADGVAQVGAPGVPQVSMVVYHDTWRKTPDGWRKAISTLHSANYGYFPAGFRSYPSCPSAESKAPGCAP